MACRAHASPPPPRPSSARSLSEEAERLLALGASSSTCVAARARGARSHPGALLLPMELVSALRVLPDDGRPVVVVCEHGLRSRRPRRTSPSRVPPATWRGMAADGPRSTGPRAEWPILVLLANALLAPRREDARLACGRGRHALLLAGRASRSGGGPRPGQIAWLETLARRPAPASRPRSWTSRRARLPRRGGVDLVSSSTTCTAAVPAWSGLEAAGSSSARPTLGPGDAGPPPTRSPLEPGELERLVAPSTCCVAEAIRRAFACVGRGAQARLPAVAQTAGGLTASVAGSRRRRPARPVESGRPEVAGDRTRAPAPRLESPARASWRRARPRKRWRPCRAPVLVRDHGGQPPPRGGCEAAVPLPRPPRPLSQAFRKRGAGRARQHLPQRLGAEAAGRPCRPREQGTLAFLPSKSPWPTKWTTSTPPCERRWRRPASLRQTSPPPPGRDQGRSLADVVVSVFASRAPSLGCETTPGSAATRPPRGSAGTAGSVATR